MTKFVRRITMPAMGYVNTTDYAATGWPTRTLIPPQQRSAIPFFGYGVDADIVNKAPYFSFDIWDGPGVEEPDFPSLPRILEEFAASYPSYWLQNNGVGSKTLFANWVRFNGTGTVAIIAQNGVSSITDNGTGAYAVNFSTAKASTAYSAIAGGANDGSSNIDAITVAYSTASVGVLTFNRSGGASIDAGIVNVQVVGP